MPLWAARILAVVLFAAAMLVLRAVLVAVLPAHNAWMDSVLGQPLHLALIAAVIVACGVYGFWPRDPEGRMRPLLPRRR